MSKEQENGISKEMMMLLAGFLTGLSETNRFAFDEHERKFLATAGRAMLALEKSNHAINHVLMRIKEDDKIRYHMGACTESFTRCVAAASAISGEDEKTLENFYLTPWEKTPTGVAI